MDKVLFSDIPRKSGENSFFPSLLVGFISVPPTALLWSLFIGGPLVILYGVAQYLFCVGINAHVRTRSFGYPAYAPFSPLGTMVAAFILVRSAVFHTLGYHVMWKGRGHTHAAPQVSGNSN
jgi:hypothetical protein